MNLPDFLTEWPRGEIVLTGHRIGLYSVVMAHRRGMTPERIHEEYPTLSVELINRVLGFHRDNQGEVDAYVDQVDRELAAQEAAYSRPGNREELLRRYAAKKCQEGR